LPPSLRACVFFNFFLLVNESALSAFSTPPFLPPALSSLGCLVCDNCHPVLDSLSESYCSFCCASLCFLPSPLDCGPFFFFGPHLMVCASAFFALFPPLTFFFLPGISPFVFFPSKILVVCGVRCPPSSLKEDLLCAPFSLSRVFRYFRPFSSIFLHVLPEFQA